MLNSVIHLYVKGIKGIIECYAMRHYLAAVAFLDTQNLPLAEQFSTRNLHLFNLIERIVKQLHEMKRSEMNISISNSLNVVINIYYKLKLRTVMTFH